MFNTPPAAESRSWQEVTRAGDLGDWLQRVSTMPLLREIANRSMELLALEPGERVLEIGCGNGVFLPLLASAVGETGAVVGLDHAPPFVQQARDRTRDVPWVRVDEGDAYALPYPNESFDATHCERVLMHLDEPTAALSEMRRVVRPGGRVVVAEPDWASIVIDSSDHEGVELLIRQANTARRQPRIGRELNRRLKAAGLIDRRIEAIPIFSLDYSELVTYGLGLPQAADVLADEGRLDRERSRAIIDALIDGSRNGTFCACGGCFVASGRRPASGQPSS
jgi:SAM-dependent methyltransferase